MQTLEEQINPEDTSETMPLFLMEARSFYEAALQELWRCIPLDLEFSLKAGGTKFKVFSRGTWNHQGGPDFLNAKLEIDGKVLHGDIEIHCRTSDWARHGHDAGYENVILHVVGEDDIAGTLAPKIPMLPVFILPEDFSEGHYKEQPPPQQKGICASFFSRLPDDAIHQFAADAGLERMRIKSDKLLTAMIARGVQNAFLSRLFELIGIPGNRQQFSDLANRIFSYPESVRTEHFTTLLWGESGELPDPSSTPLDDDAKKIVCGLWDDWWLLRRQYKEPIAFDRKCRPLNSIGRRIAILAGLIRKWTINPLPVLMAKLVEADNIKDFMTDCINSLSPDDKFWTTHTSFTAKPLQKTSALIGRDRIIELMADLIIPALRAYAMITKDFKQTAKIETVFLMLPRTGANLTIRTVVQDCFPGRGHIFRTAAAQQGLIHIRETWCKKLSGDCKACPLAQLV